VGEPPAETDDDAGRDAEPRGAGLGEFSPWPYGAGLALWAVYIALALAGVWKPWRLIVGLAAAVLWTSGVVLRRRRKRAASA
jgi:hypothetical protein